MSHNSNNAIPPVRVPMRPADANRVAALCVSGRSIYQHMAGVEAYDARRDARTFAGGCPVVAHPPCRTWSKYLRHMARPADWQGEQELGRFCVRAVIRNGGVLEQPAGSYLWQDQNLPLPNRPDDPFLYTVYIEQAWFGYATRKPTWVLVAGLPVHQLPPLPLVLDDGAKKLSLTGLSQFSRSRTMQGFAGWLCQAARATWWQFNHAN